MWARLGFDCNHYHGFAIKDGASILLSQLADHTRDANAALRDLAPLLTAGRALAKERM